MNGRVIMYADQVTASMKRALDETSRRRELQATWNREHGITPQGVRKAILDSQRGAVSIGARGLSLPRAAEDELLTAEQIVRLTREYSAEMHKAADEMEFERAAELRDRVLLLKDMDLGLKPPSRSLLETGVRARRVRAGGGRLRGRRRGASADELSPGRVEGRGRGRKRR